MTTTFLLQCSPSIWKRKNHLPRREWEVVHASTAHSDEPGSIVRKETLPRQREIRSSKGVREQIRKGIERQRRDANMHDASLGITDSCTEVRECHVNTKRAPEVQLMKFRDSSKYAPIRMQALDWSRRSLHARK